MRLTDLLRDKNGMKKSSPTFSKAVENTIYKTESDARPERNEHIGGHLHVGDLSAIYDLSAPAHAVPPPSRSPSAAPVHAETSLPDSPSTAAGPRIPIDAYEDTEPSLTDVENSVRENGYTDMKKDEDFPERTAVSQEEKITRGAALGNRNPGMTGSNKEYHENMEEVELADALHIELLTQLDDVYNEGREEKEIIAERLINPLAGVIDLCKKSNSLLRKAVRLKKGGRSFTSHSLNVSILAVKIGLSRKYPDERVFSLGLCALLGDIGMTRVNPAILSKTGKLTPEEFMEIKRHIEYSVEIVSQVSNKFPFLAPIIYQIHERDNGSGYPKGLKGVNIHEFAKIIGMCDVYIALTEPKANREKYSGYVAMQQIISRRGIDFDPKIIKSLIDVISVFPLESLVRLNNGAIGRIIDISSIHPTRPKLSILIDSDGEKLNRPALLDLEKEPLLYIDGPDIEEGVVL